MAAPTLTPRCPAATTLEGPPDRGPSIICGVLVSDLDDEQALIRNVGVGACLTSRADPGYSGDPASIKKFCSARYDHCPVWVAEQKRIRHARAKLQSLDKEED